MRKLQKLTSLDMIEKFIQEHELAFLYISRPNCGVCHGLLPQVRELLMNYPEIKLGHADADEVMEIAGRFSVFTVPVLLLFVGGKEYIREARIVHLSLLDKKLQKIYNNVVG
ncbi:thioredoxin family protein [Virgibacillus oceani]|uniref:Thioredoxin-like protein YdfQ n=1 Tax=Virgibacillus oceani TaxID=1479511 RepID=A0A917HTI8_9BACI|nr:thioredoxin family protein [Virgibacillus oceani]GGG88738.1 thioredoxin-like protein YdfQ [Virgibacillus oceani]